MIRLTIELLCLEARSFADTESSHPEPTLYGVTDGKAVGTYLEHKFRAYLLEHGYVFEKGNSAHGMDFPDIGVDMKVTSLRQPQSSCPFKSARQKIYGLGYSLIVFMNEKNLPVDDIELHNLASEILNTPPEQGYLTISNALQWRLQYSRIIEKAGTVPGVRMVYHGTRK